MTKNNSLNTGTLMMLDLDAIETDEKLNVRAKKADANDNTDMYDEIIASVKQDGILTTITVIKGSEPGKYLLVDGMGRLEAAKRYHPESKIPAYVIDQSPALAYYTLNEKRQIFTVIEEAEAIQNVYNELSPKGELHGKQIAEKMGISGPKFSEYRKIANLPEELKRKCRHLKKCTVHELRRIAGIKDSDKQEKELNAYLQELYPEIWCTPATQETQTEKTPPASNTDPENDNQTQQTPEDEQPHESAIKIAPQKRDYVKIERGRIEKFRDSFIKKTDKIETVEAKALVLGDIDRLIDFLEEKKQELSDQIKEPEVIAMRDCADQTADNEIHSDELSGEKPAPEPLIAEEIINQVESSSNLIPWNPLINTLPATSFLSQQA